MKYKVGFACHWVEKLLTLEFWESAEVKTSYRLSARG